MKKRLWLLIPLICFIGLLVVFINDVVSIVSVMKGGEEQLSEALSGLGVRGAITLILIQACQMLLVFIPSELVQVVAGATYGLWWGILVCLGGLIVGATVIYLIINVFNLKLDKHFKSNSSFNLINKLNKSQKSVFKVTLILFFLPAIPYGIICYFASSTKMKYPLYIICCVIGVMPSVILTTVLGGLLINLIGKFLWPVIIAFIAVMLLVMYLFNVVSTRKVNKMLYNEPKPTFDKVLKHRTINLPEEATFDTVFKFCKKYFNKKNNVHYDNEKIKDLKPPYIILSTHPSKPDFVYSCLSVTPVRPNVVANVYYFYKPILYKFFNKLGVIPKKLFTVDTQCIKDIMKVVKEDGAVLMMPEGRLSVNGTNQEMPKGLGKLIKKLNIPVISVVPHGAYLTGGKWITTKRKGLINIESDILFMPEDLQALTAEEIEAKINKDMAYDDFEWNQQHNIEYKGKNLLKGVEGILYICPNCNSQFSLKGHKNTITCKHCGSATHMDNTYKFTNPPVEGINNIRDWYNYQVDFEREQIKKEEFELTCEVKAKTYDEYGKGLKTLGKGVCVFNKEGLTYTTVKGKPHNAHISSQDLTTLLFGCNEDFETYINDKFYYFIPLKHKQVCVKWSICSELMHKHITENIDKNN